MGIVCVKYHGQQIYSPKAPKLNLINSLACQKKICLNQ